MDAVFSLWSAHHCERTLQKGVLMRSLNILKTIVSLGLLNAFLIAGCTSSKAPAKADKETSANVPSAAALAVLAKADAADGKVDKVVSKCVTCMLGMEGLPENAVTYGEYTLYFCSQTCKENFLKDREKALLALKFPGE